VKFAEACGARGVRIEDPARCSTQLQKALSMDGPVIIECVVDPHEPPMPAKVQTKQVKMLGEALRAGTPNRNRIALQMVKDVLDEASFDASPGHVIPSRLGKAAGRLVDRLRDNAEEGQPD
jgi:pyruvate dehydrogenase (quinone)/pyruvate oxidase